MKIWNTGKKLAIGKLNIAAEQLGRKRRRKNVRRRRLVGLLRQRGRNDNRTS